MNTTPSGYRLKGENLTPTLSWDVSSQQNSSGSFRPADGANHSKSRYEHETLATVFQVEGDQLNVLLWRRDLEPFAGCWSLPGGMLGSDELMGSSLSRHLAAKVDLTDIGYLEQLDTRSDVKRDPRSRVIATAYIALVSTDVHPCIPSDTKWFAVERLPATAFDHNSIILSGRERLRAKLTYSNLGFALVPEKFTISQLREVYNACLGHSISATNLKRVLLRRELVESTGTQLVPTSSGGRPATLYRFCQRSLHVTDPFATFRPPVLESG
jgi:ADP-ribose pyrophosphatase YjhB (NUDIX family)